MSKVLIRNARVIDPNSPHNGKQVDILIENSIITKIGTSISSDGAEVITSDNLHASPGFMDLHTHVCDPGYEQKETLATAAAAAHAGGFTTILAMPDTNPVVDHKSVVEYVKKMSANMPVQIIPAGALSENLEGKDLAELFDMHSAGTWVFCDGDQPVQNAGLLIRAMMYVSRFHGRIMARCDDDTLSHGGLMNEGPTSTKLGLKGIPALAEEVMVARNIEMADYVNAPLHFMAISTAGSVELIRKAKAQKRYVTASVHAYNLFWNDEVLSGFDTNYKVQPPLRSETDRLALLAGVEDGTIDCITSGHTPEDSESKIVEFDIAAFGMTGLETCFALANAAGKLSPHQLVQALAINPRTIAQVVVPTIKEGEKANITAFDPTAKWTYSKTKSLSKNSPALGMEFSGGILGAVC